MSVPPTRALEGSRAPFDGLRLVGPGLPCPCSNSGSGEVGTLGLALRERALSGEEAFEPVLRHKRPLGYFI